MQSFELSKPGGWFIIICMILIDVRTPAEYMSGHAEGAENVPLQDMMAGKFPDVDKASEIKVYCRSGARSGHAKILMEHHGFTNVENAGGLRGVM